MKRWLTSEDFSVRTEQSPVQVRAALIGCSWLWEKRKKARLRSNQGGADSDDTLVFVVMAGMAWRNSWKPKWRCTLHETENGSRLEVRARCVWFTRIFMWVWFGMLALVFTAEGLASALLGHNWTLLLACLPFWAFGLGLSGLGFWLPERKAKAQLCELLSGELE